MRQGKFGPIWGMKMSWNPHIRQLIVVRRWKLTWLLVDHSVTLSGRGWTRRLYPWGPWLVGAHFWTGTHRPSI